jgi:RNA polymerase sigma factor (sigma-70 family)
MGEGRLTSVLGEFAALLQQRGEGRSSADLLDLFVRRRDGAAFEALVRRHGPMVFGVCRRVLRNEHDAEDAFQATFLVLARKAASVRPRGRVGNWLYGVAYRTAMEARRAAARRRAKEAKAVPRVESSDGGGDELRAVLDRELTALPDKYREVVVLCDLEGKGRKEVAQELGCPEGTVASRLARGRSLLAKRLARYGLATGAVAAVSQEALPASLVSPTVRAAAAAGVVSARVSSLVERVVRAMLVMKLRAMTPVLLVACLVGTGAGWLYYHRAAAAQPPGGAERPDQEKLQREVDLLKADLRKALDRIAALEEKLKEGEREEVLFQGKPASYWVKALKDRDPNYRKEAVQALGGIAKVDRAVVPVIAKAMKDDDHDVARQAAIALGGIGKEGVPYLIDALKDPSQRCRDEVIDALRLLRRDAEAAVPTLIEVVKGSDQNERRVAAAALGDIGPGARAAVPTLLDLLNRGDNQDIQSAAYGLKGIGRGAKEGVPALIEVLKGPDPQRRAAAAVALGGIGPDAREAVPSLISLLKNKETSECWYAAIALGEVGPDAKAAVPALVEVLEHPGRGAGELPQRVFEAIKKIDPEAAAKVKRP